MSYQVYKSSRPVLLCVQFVQIFRISQQMGKADLMIPEIHLEIALVSVCDECGIGKAVWETGIYGLLPSWLHLIYICKWVVLEYPVPMLFPSYGYLSGYPGLNRCFNGSGTLTLIQNSYFMPSLSLNPCFNGSGTLTRYRLLIQLVRVCLNPCFNGSGTLTPVWLHGETWVFKVLILVLMEVVLWPHILYLSVCLSLTVFLLQ